MNVQACDLATGSGPETSSSAPIASASSTSSSGDASMRANIAHQTGLRSRSW